MMRFLMIVLFITISYNAHGEKEGDFVAEITLKDHRFCPEIIHAPAGRRIMLKVHNQDNTVEEFESVELRREKIIPAHSALNIILAPLKPGIYHFFGEFHQETAQGSLVVNEE